MAKNKNTNPLLERLRAISKIPEADSLEDSKILGDPEMVATEVPMINVALSGQWDGGLASGSTILAGPSKHFKTSFGLLMAAAYLKKHKDSIILFYDSEFGSPKSYFQSFGIDASRVFHVPITNIEQLKFDLVAQLSALKRGDKVVIMVDSIGNLASVKEVEDALKESSKADMTRAKALKSLFRMITPLLKLKDIPLISIAHIYMTQEMFSKPIVSGGTGLYYSSDNIWIIGRRQDKDDEGVQGYHFIINVDKSRFVKEKSKIPVSVSWEGGIQRSSGLLDIALEGGYLIKPKNGWYAPYNPTTKKEIGKATKEDNTKDMSFWQPIIDETDFKAYVEKRYRMSTSDMLKTAPVIDPDEE